MTEENTALVGSIPERYDAYLGPLMVEPYAIELISRLTIAPGDAVLELACGTGILTRHLAAKLPLGASLTATDLNEPMLAIAERKIDPVEPVTWQIADACRLPFDDDWFDTVVCQFGLMFFADKRAALREVQRLLHPDGAFIFSVWDSLESNALGRIAQHVLSGFFASDSPNFFEVACGMHDSRVTTRLVEDAGFKDVQHATVARDGHAPSPHHVATGLITGNPVLRAVEERATAPVGVVVAALADRLAAEFGPGPLAIPMRAHIFTARRP